jgi:hypothetical protein
MLPAAAACLCCAEAGAALPEEGVLFKPDSEELNKMYALQQRAAAGACVTTS